MAGFAAWLIGNRLRRVVCIAGLFLLPITSLLSAAIVVLVADLKGFPESLKDSGLALAVVVLVAFLSGTDSPVFAGSAALSWGIAALLGGLAGR